MRTWQKPWIRLWLLAAVALLTVCIGARGNLATASTVTTQQAPERVRADQLSFVADFKGDWPDEAKAGWDLAAAALSARIAVNVPVVVELTWAPLDGGFLGMGGATMSFVNFAGAPRADTYYPSALANQFAGTRLGSGSDVGVSMNSTSNWLFTGDPQAALAAGKSDFVTTVMHEVIHGMGFLGTADMVGDQGKWGDDDGVVPPEKRLIAHGQFSCSIRLVPAAGDSGPALAGTVYPGIWDQFVVNGSGQSILDTSLFPNPSSELAAQLTSGDLFWGGDNGKAANGGAPVKLFAPSTWTPASSYSHLDDGTFDGGVDAILTSAGENLPGIDLGPRVLGMLADMGWTLR